MGFAVDSVDATQARLRSDCALQAQGARTLDGVRTAIVQGPDRVRLELVEEN